MRIKRSPQRANVTSYQCVCAGASECVCVRHKCAVIIDVIPSANLSDHSPEADQTDI